MKFLVKVLSCILVCILLVRYSTSLPASNLNKVTQNEVVIQNGQDPDPEVDAKREFVKQMMIDSYHEYEKYAMGENELRPVSQTGHTGAIFGDSKIGSTIVDSLDTLIIMGLMDEYQRGRDWIAENIDFRTLNTTVSVFEINIRFMGGFLAAYAMTQDNLYRDLAHQLGQLMLPAFETETGVPYRYINLMTGVAHNSGANGPSVLAEFGTLHLEFVYLSDITGDMIFKEKVDKVRQAMKDVEKINGLYSNYYNPHTGTWSEISISIGAMGDSYYEYLLKAFLMFGDYEARKMYDDAMDGFVNNGLVKVSPQTNLLYIAERRDSTIEDRVGHLACFAGGMFALGSVTDPRSIDDGNRERDFEIGQNFTNTCHESYIRTSTRIGPELFSFSESTEVIPQGGYILRPEVVESYFILWRLTKNDIYRDYAWDAVQAYERHCKAGPGMGYSGINDVTSANPQKNDVQESFFLAETLKYLYLIFSDDSLIALDQWVFNTEAHILPIKFRNPLY